MQQLFNTAGAVVYEAGASFEYEAIRAGHFNETRAANKGAEPEALTVAKFDKQNLLFVGGERSNVVGVYEAGVYGEQVYLVLEYLEDGTLAEWLRARPRSWQEVVGVMAQARSISAA